MRNIHILHFPWGIARRRNEAEIGVTLAFGSLLLGGTYNAFAKGLTVHLSPISLLLVSEALTALFIMITMGIVPLIKTLFRERGKHLLIAMFVGILSSGIAPLLWFKGLSETTAVSASIFTGSSILFALAIDHVFLEEKINRMQVMGASVVFAGIIIAAMGPGERMGTKLLGDILVVAANIVFAFGTMLFKKHLTKMHPEAALFVRNISGIVFALAVTAFLQYAFVAEILSFPKEKVFLLLSFAFFSRFLPLTFFYGALDRISASKVELMHHAQLIASMFFAALILGEKLNSYHLFAAMCIIFGLVLEQVSSERVTKAFNHALHFRARSQHHV